MGKYSLVNMNATKVEVTLVGQPNKVVLMPGQSIELGVLTDAEYRAYSVYKKVNIDLRKIKEEPKVSTPIQREPVAPVVAEEKESPVEGLCQEEGTPGGTTGESEATPEAPVDYEAMSYSDLQTLVKERGLTAEGRDRDSYIAALTAADQEAGDQ